MLYEGCEETGAPGRIPDRGANLSTFFCWTGFDSFRGGGGGGGGGGSGNF